MTNLIKQRYAVDIAIDGETAQDFVDLFSYDLIVLDMVLPDSHGITLCQYFRQKGVNVPILMLTATDANQDKVAALDAGADDYVVKPFDFEVLCARIRALLRRDSQSSTSDIIWGELRLNPESFEVFYGTHILHTTPKEYALLELFLRHPSRVFSLDAIIENLWSFEDPPSSDAVRTHIKGLRQKLKAGGAPKDFIETVYGMGYRLKPMVTGAGLSSSPVKSNVKAKLQASPNAIAPSFAPCSANYSQTTSLQPEESQVEPQSQPSRVEIEAAVARAWTKHQGTMRERLRVLEATAVAIENGHLDQELQQAGRSQAHKLAGALGCFGFTEGSRLARELEHLLTLETLMSGDTDSTQAYPTRFSRLVRDLRLNLDGDSHQAGQFSANIAAPIQPLKHPYAPRLLLIDAAHTSAQTMAQTMAQTVATQAQATGQYIVTQHGMGSDNSLDKALLAADLEQQPPDMVILWLAQETHQDLKTTTHQQTLEHGVEWLDAINQTITLANTQTVAALEPDEKNPSNGLKDYGATSVPILLVTDIDDFRQRLELVQHGVDRLLPFSISPQDLLGHVQQIFRDVHRDFKVVMVDDDDQVLDLAQTLVSAWGIQLTTVNHPSKLWETLATVQPHMVVLDVEMPDANGLELCQVVRADARWRSLPIVFLTIHEDISTQQQAFNLGADDFIHKSRMTTELPHRILQRLRRQTKTMEKF
ncbi:MAG: response regulator [Cyanobacteria bacterium P01_F01_bin.150]